KPIFLVAIVAGLADYRDRRLETVERRFGLLASLRHGLSERRGFGFEILLVQPNLRRRAVVAASLGIVREQAWQLLRGIGPLRKGSFDRGGIEWCLPAHHLHDRFCVIVILFHQVFAGFHGILLSHEGTDADNNRQGGKNRTSEHRNLLFSNERLPPENPSAARLFLPPAANGRARSLYRLP